MVEKEPRITANEIQAELQGRNMSMSDRNIYRFLNESGLRGKRPRRTAFFKEKHNKASLEYATMCINKLKSLWEKIIWADESKLELFGKSHQPTDGHRREK